MTFIKAFESVVTRTRYRLEWPEIREACEEWLRAHHHVSEAKGTWDRDEQVDSDNVADLAVTFTVERDHDH